MLFWGTQAQHKLTVKFYNMLQDRGIRYNGNSILLEPPSKQRVKLYRF